MKAHFALKGHDGRIVYRLTLKFESTNKTKWVLDRILVEQQGSDWPTFAVSELGNSCWLFPLTVLTPPTAQGLFSCVRPLGDVLLLSPGPPGRILKCLPRRSVHLRMDRLWG
jgi:hypothetical protein